MKMLVTGGSGNLGGKVVATAAARGHDVVAMTREHELDVPDGASFVTADLLEVSSLSKALEGVEVVVHCATDPRGQARETEVTGTENLLAAMQTAHVPHIVYVSIVGIDQGALAYYKVKLEAEELILNSSIGWTIQRATQFHDLIVMGFAMATKKLPVIPVPRGFRFQVIDARDCATRLVELAEGSPAGRVPDIGGPEIRAVDDLARSYTHARGISKRVIRLPALGKRSVVFKNGGNLCPDNPYGTITFEEYLAERYGGSDD